MGPQTTVNDVAFDRDVGSGTPNLNARDREGGQFHPVVLNGDVLLAVNVDSILLGQIGEIKKI